jgi:hypothetical protein
VRLATKVAVLRRCGRASIACPRWIFDLIFQILSRILVFASAPYVDWAKDKLGYFLDPDT